MMIEKAILQINHCLLQNIITGYIKGLRIGTFFWDFKKIKVIKPSCQSR